MKKIIISLLWVASIGVSASDFKTIDTDRYTEVVLKPTVEQVNPLKDVVQIRFPVQVSSVYDAIIYVLDDSGYALVPETIWTEEMKIMLESKLPLVQRDLADNPMTILNVIEVVAGEPFRVVMDPLRRRLSFELKDEYKGLING